MSLPTFELPDLITSSALTTFEFSPAAGPGAAAVLAGGPEAVFQRLLRDQETEEAFLLARRILHGFLPEASGGDADADQIAAEVAAGREDLAAAIGKLPASEHILRQRAPVALVGGCWLDTLSQPAMQPSVIVNELFGHLFVLKGEGDQGRSLYHRRRRALAQSGIHLPEIAAAGFLEKAQARPLTAWHASFHVALSRLPASFLPEVVGVHYAYFALGVDDLLTGLPPMLDEAGLRAVLRGYLELAGEPERARLLAAVRLVVELEREHVAMLAELADWHAGLPLDARVAEIVARHAPYAGLMHRDVRVAGERLVDTFAAPDFDAAAFLTRLRASPYLKPDKNGDCRLLKAIKFGGPMFAIFNQDEATTITSWVAEVRSAGELTEITLPVNRVGDGQAARWAAAVEAGLPGDVVFAEFPQVDDREMFFRLVNIEHFPNTRRTAKLRAEAGLADGEILFTHGTAGRYTDGSWFDYSPEALWKRVESVYWDKMVNPYRPLEEIPGRDQVVFHQKTMALGNLVEASWAHRLGGLGRFHRPSDAMMFAIYADEVGRGELRKNHIQLIHQVLASMDVRLPHVRDAAFLEQEELPDSNYYFVVHQLSLATFPDSLYAELLGYNLAVEMYGLGEIRMHEIEKLRAHGFDTGYEEAHLSIDNVSTGHSRQSVDVITTYLDGVERDQGRAAVEREWRRVWRGYCAFAYFTEHQLVASLSAGEEAELLI